MGGVVVFGTGQILGWVDEVFDLDVFVRIGEKARSCRIGIGIVV